MTRRIIGEDLELRTFLEPNLYRVSVDRGQVEQILLNLVVNARDALPRGGRLTFETSNVYLDEAYLSKHKGAQASGHYAMLAISDSGCGMDAATQKRIFELHVLPPGAHTSELHRAHVARGRRAHRRAARRRRTFEQRRLRAHTHTYLHCRVAILSCAS